MTADRRTSFLFALVLLALLGTSALVAWQIPLPDKIPTVAWNSSWVFRAEVFVGFFIGAYVVLVILITTIASGQPPKKLSFGLLALEQQELQKTVEALSEGGTALQAVGNEARELEARIDTVHEAAKSAHLAILDLAKAAQDEGGEAIAQRSRKQVEALSRKPDEPEEPRQDFIRAMARFDALLSDLDELRTSKSE
jgi:hypothetical protein